MIKSICNGNDIGINSNGELYTLIESNIQNTQNEPLINPNSHSLKLCKFYIVCIIIWILVVCTMIGYYYCK